MRSLDADKLPRPFGPYVLVRKVATGGMAEIYVARARGIGGFEKNVALKVIHPRYSEDEHFVRMLIDEAKLSVMLTHANIAQTFDLGCVDGRYFIVMELVEGADASKLIRKGFAFGRQLPIDAALYITQHVAQGLDYAHRKTAADGTRLNVIHRDVSPHNVLLSLSGEVKLADFGIAKAALRTSETEVGILKGKYYYMSPEQAWADPMDHRSDVFSVGVVLYELLTGHMLYQLEDNLPALLDRVRRAEVEPPSKLRPEIPPPVDEIVLTALARQPGDRYASAADFALAIEHALFALSPGYGSSKLSRVMRDLIGEVPSGENDVLPTKISAGVSAAATNAQELEEHARTRGLERGGETSADVDPDEKGEGKKDIGRVAGVRSARRTIVEEPSERASFDARDAQDEPDSSEDEEDATTFYRRDESFAVPSSTPYAREQREVEPSVDAASVLEERAARSSSQDVFADEATVIDSSGELSRFLGGGLGGAHRMMSADAPMMVEARPSRPWTPPRPSWDPLPFVGPPLAEDQAASTFTIERRHVYTIAAAIVGIVLVALVVLALS